METTIGGDRLGSGNKQTVSFRNYERSSHDLGFTWRSTMSSGTLVPFLSKVALPGDNWKINLNCDVLTLPTIGPLFGSYKVQLDVFEVPMRLYNAKLHMNKLGVGMDMSKIFLPQIQVLAKNPRPSKNPTYADNEQINASCLLKYLGISGLGAFTGNTDPVYRYFNAVPILAVWDIYKNYYSNKQEEIGYYIHTSSASFTEAQTPSAAIATDAYDTPIGPCLGSAQTVLLNEGDKIIIQYPLTAKEVNPSAVLAVSAVPSDVPVTTIFNIVYWDASSSRLVCEEFKDTYAGVWYIKNVPSETIEVPTSFFGLKSFPLENIDLMREKILQYAGSSAFVIGDTELEPYSSPMKSATVGGLTAYAAAFSQECLPIKTYQSDLFNNWINTEWIDGAGGISELTAVDTTDGSFTIDALNIASKVYDMLNRIAVSGGSYDDWLEAVYTHERVKGVENPVYCGSLIKELAFQEVVSQTDTETSKGNKPLGTLAGKGTLTGKHKGGEIMISVNEPSYIIGLVSITPRVDYSQGNEWDVNLKTYDDFHKPALDGIGFQDLITEQLLWSDSTIDSSNEMEVSQKSLGKQPAWINYMTAVNKTFGGFAEQSNAMFMTLNRRYERKADGSGALKDGTTYIDPTKYNNIFAEVALDSQNFWVQINLDIVARRKMSAKIIPNL